ncbi:hypothetical protein BH10ACT8_BH10ACT8_32100 [soil metagenome]
MSDVPVSDVPVTDLPVSDVPVTDREVIAPASVPPGIGPSGAAAQIPLATIALITGAALLAGAYLGTVPLLIAVAVAQLVLVLSWVFGTGLPGRIGAVVIGVLASGAADAALVRWNDHGYQPVLGVLGVALPVMFIHQLTRGVVRTRVVESLADITVLLLSVCSMAGLVLLRYQGNGDRTTLAVIGAIGAGLVVAHLTDAVFPVLRFDPKIDRGLPAVVLGIAAGGAVGTLALRDIIDYAGGRALFVGAAVAAVACLLSIGASFAGVHSTLLPGRLADGRAVGARAEDNGEAAGEVAPVVGAAGLDKSTSDAAGQEQEQEQEQVDDIRVWSGVPRLRPVAAVLISFALAVPAGYVLVTALGA